MRLKFIVGLLLGGMVELLLHVFHDVPPMPAFRQLGADLVTKHLAQEAALSSLKLPRVVLVDVDEASMVAWGKSSGDEASSDVLTLLENLRRSNARVIVVDITFAARGNEPNRLLQFAGGPGTPIVAIADIERPLRSVGQGRSLPTFRGSYGGAWEQTHKQPPSGLRLATGEFDPDEDGMVRQRVAASCVDTGADTEAISGVAETVALALGGGRDATCDIRTRVAKAPIFYVEPWPIHSEEVWGGVHRVPAANVVAGMNTFSDAIVVVGQTHDVAGDRVPTPLGPMPGVMVHLNAIGGLLLFGSGEEAEAWIEVLAMGGGIVVVALVYLLYWLPHEGFIRERTMEPSAKGFALFVLDAVIFIAVTYLALRAVLSVFVLVGRGLLSQGIIFGTVVPAFALILEAAMEIGRPLIFWLEEFASLAGRRIVAAGRGTFVPAVLLLASVPGAARAESDSGRVAPVARIVPTDSTPATKIDVERQSGDGKKHHHKAAEDLFLLPNDVVRVLDDDGQARVVMLRDGQELGRVRKGRALVVPGTASEHERPLLAGGTRVGPETSQAPQTSGPSPSSPPVAHGTAPGSNRAEQGPFRAPDLQRTRKALLFRNYTTVYDLVLDPDGIVRGFAARPGRMVLVTVDLSGNVAEYSAGPPP